MDVRTAKTAGFCFGVKKAVDAVYEAIETNETIYTYGPIIHNEQVIKELSGKGVRIINDINELDGIEDGTVIIRSHGVGKEVYEALEKRNLKIIDATCPFVLKIHKLVRDEALKGKKIVIAGNRDHPEVQGIISFAGDDVTVIEEPEDAVNFSNPGRKSVCLAAQTTFNVNKFKEIVEIFDKKEYSVNVVNTICNATSERQKEAGQLASDVDCMIVIGDVSSSNSKKLYEICLGLCHNTVFVQTLDDLVSRNDIFSKSTACVGITAGASTPNKIIEEVQRYVRRDDI
ncbi:MAG: 4-hydroxy-3-methylbut-2-enyl diphosphate reductase [Lachnospiraceae bacterium]|nr:4-hydroxy-3-methylbut-2-enyl diphosphate reductase [Lachnospiraceae bacterium]